MRRRAIAWALRAVGPALMIVVILKMPDRAAIGDAVLSADPWLFLAAIGLNFPNLQLKVLRWTMLLRAQGRAYSVRRAWSAYLSSLYVGMLTPGRVGDVVRVQYVRHDLGMSYADGLAGVVMDRFCDLYVLLLFSAVGAARFWPLLAGDIAMAAWGAVVLVTVVPLLFLIPGVAEGFARIVYAKMAKRSEAEAGFSQFLKSLRAFVGKPLLGLLPMTAAAFLVNYVQGYLLARAMGLSISLFDILGMMAIASLLGLMPISISGMGVREVFFALVFPALGYTAAGGVSFGLLVFAVMYLCLVAVGFLSWQWAPPPSGGQEKDAAGAKVFPPSE